jgi:hypothetical protein
MQDSGGAVSQRLGVMGSSKYLHAISCRHLHPCTSFSTILSYQNISATPTFFWNVDSKERDKRDVLETSQLTSGATTASEVGPSNTARTTVALLLAPRSPSLLPNASPLGRMHLRLESLEEARRFACPPNLRSPACCLPSAQKAKAGRGEEPLRSCWEGQETLERKGVLRPGWTSWAVAISGPSFFASLCRVGGWKIPQCRPQYLPLTSPQPLLLQVFPSDSPFQK